MLHIYIYIISHLRVKVGNTVDLIFCTLMERDHKYTEDQRKFHILYISLLGGSEYNKVPDGLKSFARISVGICKFFNAMIMREILIIKRKPTKCAFLN